MKSFIYLILMISTMVAIFYFSTDTGTETNEKSGAIVKPIEDTIKANSNKTFETEKEETDYWKKLHNKLNIAVRKSAHATIYGLLSIFSLLFFKSVGLKDADALMMAILLCALYAGSDELHQQFSQGRDGKMSDVCIDTFGAWVGSLIMYITEKIQGRRGNKYTLSLKRKG